MDITRIELTTESEEYLREVLYPLLVDTPIEVNKNRKNCGVGKTQVFGYGFRKFKGYGELSNNKKYPDLWRAILTFGKMIVPTDIPFTGVQINHNYETKKHIDKNNIGYSLSVSFGDFEGGELVINDVEYQTNLYPIIFNGALNEHYNKPIKGDRYSLVYFVLAPKYSSDVEILEIHKQITTLK